MTTTSAKPVAPWPGLPQRCPVWCAPGTHHADDMHGDRYHRSHTPDFPVLSLTPDSGEPGALYVELQQHADDRAPHVRLVDETRNVTYTLRLTIDEAEGLSKQLLDLVTQAVQGY